jgi:hypothetical protein
MKLMSSKATIRKFGSRYELIVTDRFMDSFGQISKQNKVWGDYATREIANREMPKVKQQMRNLGHKV